MSSNLESNAEQNLKADIDEIFSTLQNRNISEYSVIFDSVLEMQQKNYALNFRSYLVQIMAFNTNFEMLSNVNNLSADDMKTFLTQVKPYFNSAENADNSFKFKIKNDEYLGIMKKANNIYLLLYTPLVSTQAVLSNITMSLILTLFIAGLLAIGAGFLLADSIAKPIIALKSTAVEISKRNFSRRIDINTNDEIGDLGNTINKMALDLSEYDMAQKKFLQNASHELKTPLMSIQGYAEAMKDGVLENTGEALDIIIDESMRLNRIVESLVYLSRVETMEDFLKFDLENINEIIQACIKKVGSIALKNNIKIELVPTKEGFLYIDRDKMSQAFINILSNCLRYARSVIFVEAMKQGGNMIITVTDDGTGFTQEDLNHAFQRFYKGEKGITGLGMAITKAIIERHGGNINISNNEKGGARFTLIIPMKRAVI